jgi:hypothetical protein
LIRNFFKYLLTNDFKIKVKGDLLRNKEWDYAQIQSFDSSISSHWEKYYAFININIISHNNLKLIQIKQMGLANLNKSTIVNSLINLPSVMRNVRMYLKYTKNIKILSKIVLISIKTKRVICFDMIKHGILLSKISFLFKDKTRENIVIIGDGFGFLGILIKTLYPALQISYINLQKNLFLDLLFYKIYFSHKFESPKIFDAGSLPSLKNGSALIFNVASFAEMTENSINQYLDWIQKNEGILVSLNRQEKMHPNGDNLNLEACFEKFSPDYLVNWKNVQWYSKFPTNKFRPSYLPFDGPFDLKLLKI